MSSVSFHSSSWCGWQILIEYFILTMKHCAGCRWWNLLQRGCQTFWNHLGFVIVFIKSSFLGWSLFLPLTGKTARKIISDPYYAQFDVLIFHSHPPWKLCIIWPLLKISLYIWNSVFIIDFIHSFKRYLLIEHLSWSRTYVRLFISDGECDRKILMELTSNHDRLKHF